MNVTIVGLGYIGTVMSVCCSALRHKVVGIDINQQRVDDLRAGRAPFEEPELDAWLQAARRGLNPLTCYTWKGASAASPAADVYFVCVPTPVDPFGTADLRFLDQALGDIATLANGRRALVAIRSTVPPGTLDERQRMFPSLQLVSNPEFLREGSAIADFMWPTLLVTGSYDPSVAAPVLEVYKACKSPHVLMMLPTEAELLKYACNAWHATKVTFANEIGRLAAACQAAPHTVMQALTMDERLNTSAAYLKPGFAYGGPCLPKDLRVLAHMDTGNPLLTTIAESNYAHTRAAIRNLPLGAKIGLYGLAFKPGTSDFRDSPYLTFAEEAARFGCAIRIYEPYLNGAKLGNIVVEPELPTFLAWADCILLAREPAPSFETSKKIIRIADLPFLH